MSNNSLIFFREFRGDIHARSLTFRGLSSESQNFPRIIPRKGMSFRGIIRGKSKFSADYTAERHAFPRYNPRKGMLSRIILRKGRLFHDKIHEKFLLLAESQNIPRIILRKSMPFRRIIHGKSKLSANYPRKVSVHHGKVKISLFKGL
jgi:hypothetical protein